jgi:hypothetical protein
MNEYTMGIFAEARRERLLDEAARGRLARLASVDLPPSISWRARLANARVRRLAHPAEAS